MAVTFIGAGTLVAATSYTPVVIPYPTGYTPAVNDLIIIFIAARITNGNGADCQINFGPGNIFGITTNTFVSGNTLYLQYLNSTLWQSGYRTDGPLLSPDTDWASGPTGWAAFVAVYSGTSGVTSTSTASNVASATFQALPVTTTVNDSVVVSYVSTYLVNALGLQTANGFTAQASGASYDTSTGGNYSHGIADITQATAGSVTAPVWTKTAGNDSVWASATFILPPSSISATKSTSTISTSVIFNSPTVSPLNATTTPARINTLTSMTTPVTSSSSNFGYWGTNACIV